MTTLHLGVLDVGYTDAQGTTTTGDVAEILESRYHIMRTFVELKEDLIARVLVDQVAGAIESIAQGKRMTPDWKPSMGKIEEAFRDFIDSGEMQTQFTSFAQTLPEGLTIQAAAEGINHRMKDPDTGTSRVAFKDTGLYQASFRAWVT